MTATNNLRLKLLADHAANDSLMPSQYMHLIPSPDIPDSHRRISAASEYQIQSGMLGHTIHSGQLPMVITYYFVVLKVPTFHSLVLRHRVQIRVFTIILLRFTWIRPTL